MPLHQQPAQQKGQELLSVSLSHDAGHCVTDSSLIGLDLWKQIKRVKIPVFQVIKSPIRVGKLPLQHVWIMLQQAVTTETMFSWRSIKSH